MDLSSITIPHVISIVKAYFTKADIINKFHVFVTFIIMPDVLDEWFEHGFANRSTSKSPLDDKVGLIYTGILLVVIYTLVISDIGISLLYWVYLSLFTNHVLL